VHCTCVAWCLAPKLRLLSPLAITIQSIFACEEEDRHSRSALGGRRVFSPVWRNRWVVSAVPDGPQYMGSITDLVINSYTLWRSRFNLGYLSHILRFWTLSIVLSLSKTPSCLFFKTQCFGDWILSPFSGKTYSVGPNQLSRSLSPEVRTIFVLMYYRHKPV
jgi:hypothetical protein